MKNEGNMILGEVNNHYNTIPMSLYCSTGHMCNMEKDVGIGM